MSGRSRWFERNGVREEAQLRPDNAFCAPARAVTHRNERSAAKLGLQAVNRGGPIARSNQTRRLALKQKLMG